MADLRSLLAATVLAGVALAAPARAGQFCLDASIDDTNHFYFKFNKKYPMKVDKITPIYGTVTIVTGGVPTGGGPAFGEILGLPEGEAGNAIAVTFATDDLSGVARVTLDDNGWTTGGGKVFRNPGSPVDVGGQIVDCATLP